MSINKELVDKCQCDVAFEYPFNEDMIKVLEKFRLRTLELYTDWLHKDCGVTMLFDKKEAINEF